MQLNHPSRERPLQLGIGTGFLFFFCENFISFKRLPHTQQSIDMVVSSIFLCGSKTWGQAIFISSGGESS